jgi:DNA-binding NarL/FixJ family response regulator
MQFASEMLSRPSSIWFVGMINPIIASCFQALAIAYTWISDKIAQADVQYTPAQPTKQIEQVNSVQIEIAQPSEQPKQIAQRSVCTDDQLIQIAQLHNDGLSVRKIAQQVGVSPSTVQNKLKIEQTAGGD